MHRLPSKPDLPGEAGKIVLRFVHILGNLSAPIEDRAVPARAQNVQVQRSLTPLALRPQEPVLSFQCSYLQQHGYLRIKPSQVSGDDEPSGMRNQSPAHQALTSAGILSLELPSEGVPP